MQLTSLVFLLFFMGVFAINYLLPLKWRWLFLLFASYFFYATWKLDYVLVILVITVATYFIARGLENNQNKSQRILLLGMGLLVTLGGLFAFKYFNFFSYLLTKSVWKIFGMGLSMPKVSWIAPIGISFYTLQIVSYLVDVYRGTIQAERHFGIYALYVSFFPQIVAGPISRAKLMLPQYREVEDFNEAQVVVGLRQALWGAFQKLAIADRLALMANPYFSSPADYSSLHLVYGTYLFAFQILADFAGYSNMAIGVARALGFKLAENFNRPYFAIDANEFWNRWHMSFSTWLRDYIFYPVMRFLRKNWPKAGKFIIIVIPPMLTMLVSGLWHGAGINFLIWGFLHGIYLTLSVWTAGWRKRILSKDKIGHFSWITDFCQGFLTFNLITFAWIFFRAENLSTAKLYLNHIIHWLPSERPIPRFEFGLAVFLLVILLIGEILQGKPVTSWYAKQPRALRWGIYVIGIIALLFFGVFKETEFFYAQF